MRHRCAYRGRHLLPAFLVVMLSGCAGMPVPRYALPHPDFEIELTETAFFPQQDYQCGPAALATVLEASGVDVTPTDLVPSVYTPGRRGSLQVDMLAATRAAGRVAYRLNGSLQDIVDELRAGRPVVVLQNLGVKIIPRWHYAVVVGINGPDDTVILRSGTDRRRATPIKLFLRTWARGERWALTALPPGELPANVDRERYLDAIADLEEIGQVEAAVPAWRAALKRWPGDLVAQFGLGNALLASDRAAEAAAVYRDLLLESPDLVAVRNNLALALLKQGQLDDALSEIKQALGQTADAALEQELLDTRLQIQRAREHSKQ